MKVETQERITTQNRGHSVYHIPLMKGRLGVTGLRFRIEDFEIRWTNQAVNSNLATRECDRATATQIVTLNLHETNGKVRIRSTATLLIDT